MDNDTWSDGSGVDFNFWPSFADAMLALVFVLVLVIFLTAAGMQAGTFRIQEIRERQVGVAQRIATAQGGSLDIVSTGSHYRVCQGSECGINVYNDVQLQRITFSDRILFSTGRYELSQMGQEVLRNVGRVVLDQLDDIYQIQIEGHTDPDAAPQYAEGNLELGARRAMTVYRFLQESVGIDPARYLMSANSYGEYKPVTRAETSDFSPEQLAMANGGPAAKDANRRIELLLFYR